jgi:hypothetical protein
MFHLIEHFTHLLMRERGVVEKVHKVSNSLLKVNVIFPEGVIGIKKQIQHDALLFPALLEQHTQLSPLF